MKTKPKAPELQAWSKQRNYLWTSFTGANTNVEGQNANLASLKLGIHDREGIPHVVKVLDENLQWNDSALEVLLSSFIILLILVQLAISYCGIFAFLNASLVPDKHLNYSYY